MANDTPQWAIEEALRRIGSKDPAEVLAEIIAANEEPVDYDLIEARQVARDSYPWTTPEGFVEGKKDHYAAVRVALAGIARGRELARQ